MSGSSRRTQGSKQQDQSKHQDYSNYVKSGREGSKLSMFEKTSQSIDKSKETRRQVLINSSLTNQQRPMTSFIQEDRNLNLAASRTVNNFSNIDINRQQIQSSQIEERTQTRHNKLVNNSMGNIH